jgi:hypothetical protein
MNTKCYSENKKGRDFLLNSMRRWKNNIKEDFRDAEYEDVDLISVLRSCQKLYPNLMR